jgi:hypothetical protein
MTSRHRVGFDYAFCAVRRIQSHPNIARHLISNLRGRCHPHNSRRREFAMSMAA